MCVCVYSVVTRLREHGPSGSLLVDRFFVVQSYPMANGISCWSGDELVRRFGVCGSDGYEWVR